MSSHSYGYAAGRTGSPASVPPLYDRMDAELPDAERARLARLVDRYEVARSLPWSSRVAAHRDLEAAMRAHGSPFRHRDVVYAYDKPLGGLVRRAATGPGYHGDSRRDT